jgi:hypothetical protein
MLKSCTNSDVLAGVLPLACSCAIVGLCTASVACCWCWLASDLPSSPDLAAVCPSPPGLAPGPACPSPPGMISWFLFAWLGLVLHLASIVFCWMWFLMCCCGRTVMFFVWLGAVCKNSGVLEFVLVEWAANSPWCSSPGRLLGVAGSCGAASTTFACSD